MRTPFVTRSVLMLPVFIPAVAVALLIVIGTISNPELAGEAFSALLAWITRNFGWFYLLAVASFLVFVLAIALSPWGKICLGPDHGAPQYSFPVWFAMLFATGYGIALLFFGVAEPVLHYATPPQGAPQTVDAAKQAMQSAFFHWGFHIWAIYGLTGLVLAYFAFRHGLPLSMRSALYPLIGERIYGPIGHAVDVFAILGTLFGIATTLGLSVAQINAGLNYLWPNIPVSTTMQILCIAAITGVTTLSVAAGLDRGIKRLSVLNMILAASLMLFVFLSGPTLFILETFVQNTGSYLSSIVERTFNLQAYTGGDWIGNWTLFIFGWTIAWAPFVGLFIARISRGRTIREFVLGVLCVPTVVTFLWFSVFGDTALYMIMHEGYTTLIDEVQADSAIALFKLLEQLPFTQVVSFLTLILIAIFFVTSADSGSLVTDALASGGAVLTPVWQRVFWALLQGTLAAALLVAGGLSALQTMSIASALPFTGIMLVAAVGMWRALVIEGHQNRLRTYMHNRRPGVGPHAWKRRLAGLIEYPTHSQASDFLQTRAVPALKKVAEAVSETDWPNSTGFDPASERAWVEIVRPGQVDFLYEIRVCAYPRPDFASAPAGSDGDNLYYRTEVFTRRGNLGRDIYGFGEQEIIDDVLDEFEKYLYFLHVSPGILPWKTGAHDEALAQAAAGNRLVGETNEANDAAEAAQMNKADNADENESR